MKPVVPTVAVADNAKVLTFGANQPQYIPLPAIQYDNGQVLTEWELTEEERAAIATGENIRLWTSRYSINHHCQCGVQTKKTLPFQPVFIEVTSEHE